MSEDEQFAAVGRAIKAADDSSKKMHALAAEINEASERFKSVSDALKEVILVNSPGMRVHDAQSELTKIQDVRKVSALVAEYEETARQNPALQERAKALRGLS